MNSDRTGPWNPIARGSIIEGRAGRRWSPSASITGPISPPGMWAGMPNTGTIGVGALGRLGRAAAYTAAGAALERKVVHDIRGDGEATAAAPAPSAPSSSASAGPKHPAIVTRPTAGSKRGHVLTDVHVKGSRMGMGPRAGIPRSTPIDVESWEVGDTGPAPSWSAAAARKVSPLEFPSVRRPLALPAGGPGRPSGGRNPGAPSPSAPGPENIDLRTPEGRKRWADMGVTGKTHIRLGGGFD